MSLRSSLSLSALLSALVLTATAATAQVRITEVAPWSSGNSAVEADWFELTNLGSNAVDEVHNTGRINGALAEIYRATQGREVTQIARARHLAFFARLLQLAFCGG